MSKKLKIIAGIILFRFVSTLHFKERGTAYAFSALSFLGYKPLYHLQEAKRIATSKSSTYAWLDSIFRGLSGIYFFKNLSASLALIEGRFLISD